jgi:YD repeat-containing protein
MTNPTTKILPALLALALTTGAASAQFLPRDTAGQRTFYDSRGNVVSRSSTSSSGAVTNYDSRGHVVSRETTSGNTTTVYDDRGRNVGRVTTSRLPPDFIANEVSD